MNKLTIIVPLYNEEENLLRVEQKLGEYAEEASIPTKILLVNDGSTDNSLELVKSICARNEQFSYISFFKNAGLSAAIKAGIDHVDTSLTGYIDSDLQTDPFDFEVLLKEIGPFDLVNGYRNQRKDSFKKNMSSTIANNIRNLFTGDGMYDTGCPLKIIKTEFAQRIPMFKGLHRFLPAMILLQGGRITQIPIRHYPRVAGTPKFGLRNRLVKPLIDCFAFLWMKRNYINYQVVDKDISLPR
jgi:dolichol-phosphate mannosyltransferase